MPEATSSPVHHEPAAPPPPPAPAPGGSSLRRSRDDRVIAGVCGGLGKTLGLDPVLLRVLFVLFTVMGGSGVLIYLVLWLVVPEEPVAAPREGAPAASVPRDHNGAVATAVVGAALVVFGFWMLLDRIAPGVMSLAGRIVAPLLLVAVGLALLLRRS